MAAESKGSFIRKGRIEVFADSRIMLRAKDAHLSRMYAHMLKELNDICDRYDAWVDLTTPGKLFITDCSAGCRRTIRKVYGSNSVVFRHGKITELGGFI